jgi:transcriptional regulator with XRE-family HTH domain
MMHGTFERDLGEVLDAEMSRRLSVRLHQARLLRNMTLKMVANTVGCSESMLSKIENGKAYPSLPVLDRLVRALNVTIGWVFDEPEGKAPIIYRTGSGSTLPVEDRAIAIERIIPDTDAHDLRANIVHLGAGATSEGESRHAGEETGFLLDGQIELLIDGRPHRLNSGDAFAFRADQPHSFRNIGASRATLFWVNSPSVM